MPTADLVASDESIRCSYHTLPELLPIERVSWYGTAPVHSFSIDLDPQAGHLVGTMDTTCELSDQTVTLLSTKRQISEVAMPVGAPLELPAGITVVLRVHFLNPEDLPNVGDLYVDLHPAPQVPELTSGIIGATRMDFTVPLGASSQETRCRPPAGVGISTVYPQSRRLGYETRVRDEATQLAYTYDWEHPPPTFFAPAHVPTGELVTRCNLVNPYGMVGEGGTTLLEERCGMSMLVVPGSGVSSCLIR